MPEKRPDIKKLLKEINESRHERENPKSSGCGVALLKLIFIVPTAITLSLCNYLMLAFTTSMIWEWLISPFVNYTPNFILILGAYIIFGLFKFRPDVTKKDYKPQTEDMFIVFFAVIIVCSFALLYGWVFSNFV